MAVLLAIDVLGVQRFIFSSNRLRDVVAASWLVHWSTSPVGALKDLVHLDNVILAGGGNAILEFESEGLAKEFVAAYTRCLIDEAPGIEVAVVYRTFSNGTFAEALQHLQIDLARTKTERIPSAPLLGLSVTAACRETGLPAIGFDSSEPIVPLSRTILKRRERLPDANERWAEYLKDEAAFGFPLELDHLGRTRGDTSLIGVVHVDGNGVGRKIMKWLLEKAEKRAPDAEVRLEYREWSRAIDQLCETVFRAVVDCVFNAQRTEENNLAIVGRPKELGFPLKRVDGKWMLPLRPILLGGPF